MATPYSVAGTLWASIAQIAGLAKASIGAVAGEVVAVVLSWVRYNTGSYAYCVESLADGIVITVGQGDGVMKKWNCNTNALVSTYTMGYASDSGSCIDGNYIYVASYNSAIIRVNYTDWSSYYKYDGGYHPSMPATGSAISYVICGDTGGSGAVYCNKAGTGGVSFISGTTAATGQAAFDGTYAWIPQYYYTSTYYLYKINPASTPSVVKSIALPGAANCCTYDAANGCLWLAKDGTTALYKFVIATETFTTYTLSVTIHGRFAMSGNKLAFRSGSHVYLYDPATTQLEDTGAYTSDSTNNAPFPSNNPAYPLCYGSGYTGQYGFYRRQ